MCYDLERWSAVKKPFDEADKCSECNQLVEDGNKLRCSMYGGAIVMNSNEKHCEDSVM